MRPAALLYVALCLLVAPALLPGAHSSARRAGAAGTSGAEQVQGRRLNRAEARRRAQSDRRWQQAIAGRIIVKLKSWPSGGGAAGQEEEESSPSLLAEQGSQLLWSLSNAGVRYTVRHRFTQLLNGVVLQLSDPAQASLVAGLEGVEAVIPTRIVRLPPVSSMVQHSASASASASATTQAGSSRIPSMEYVHQMTGVARVHRVLGVLGKGLKVGLIDSGIDYTHPAFGGCSKVGAPGCRVTKGWDFVGDDFMGGDPSDPNGANPARDNDPMDCMGHGTHVGGIVAGNDSRVVGVAPAATLAAYRVFSCAGETTTDIILAAMERAYTDGQDVVNLSLGGGSAWPDDPLAAAADKLMARGVLVFGAFGNYCSYGLWQGNAPAVSAQGFGVASFDNQLYMGSVFQVGQDKRAVSYSMDESQTSLVRNAPLTASPTDGCSAFGGRPFSGKILLIVRGGCTFLTKAMNAQAAGAAAAVIYNNATGSLPLSVTSLNLDIPVAGIAQADGLELLKRAAKGSVQVQWLAGTQLAKNPTGGQVSSFSSWGPAPGSTLKPDLGAPGGLIFSTWPVSMGKYQTLSGTSMATPYAAGVAALYLQSQRDAGNKLSPRAVKLALMNTAVPAALLDGGGIQTPVSRQGAGLVNALRAIRSKTRVSPAALQLGYQPSRSATLTITRNLTVANSGAKPVKYQLSHVPAASVNGANSAEPKLGRLSPRVVLRPSSVTVAPGKPRQVQVRVTLSSSAKQDLLLHSGYIQVKPVTQGVAPPEYAPSYVPYTLLSGAHRVMATGTDGPYVQRYGDYLYGSLSAPVYKSAQQTATFTFKAGSLDYPVFAVRILFPTPLLTFGLYNYGNNSLVGYVDYEKGQGVTPPDITSSNYYNVVTWPTAKVLKDPVKSPKLRVKVLAGEYYVKIAAQRALGRSKAFESWRGPKLVLKF